MGFVIVAVLSPSATNLATVAGAATLVGPEQPREKSSPRYLPLELVGQHISNYFFASLTSKRFPNLGSLQHRTE
jgi:hypothetical protein